MKLTNKQVVNSIGSINELNEQKLPIVVAFKLSKLTRSLDSIIQDYNKALNKLREEYGKRDEDGNLVMANEGGRSGVVLEDPKGYSNALTELLEVENDVEVEQFSLEDFGDIAISPSVLYPLDWLIAEKSR